MPENGREELLEMRRKLGLTQREAGEHLKCSTQTIWNMEAGARKVSPYRAERIREVLAAFAAGGQEAVAALPAFEKPPAHRVKGGWKAAIPPGDAQEMVDWRVAMNLTQRAAVPVVGLGIHSIRAIERGYMRITERVRENMESYERKMLKG